MSDLLELLRQLRAFRVLDPACGSGNFLFVAYRALRELEQNLLVKLFTQDKRQFEKVGTASGISPKQFFGLDVNDNAVETAKVTLMLKARGGWPRARRMNFGTRTRMCCPAATPTRCNSRKTCRWTISTPTLFAPTRCSRRGRKWKPSSVIRRFWTRAA